MMDRNKAFVNCLANARDVAEYEREIAAALGTRGFDLVALEDVEPLATRLRRASVAEDLLSLAEQVRADGSPKFGTFHTWTAEE